MKAAPRRNRIASGPTPSRAATDTGLARLLELAMRNSVEKVSAMLQIPILIDGATVTPAAAGLLELPAATNCVAVLLGIRGETGGNLLMSLTQAGAAELCEMAPPEFKEFMPDPQERLRALLEEMANLLASTYLDVFSEVCSLRLLPTPPSYLAAPSSEVSDAFFAPLSGSSPPSGARLLCSHLVLRAPQVRMLVAAALPGDAVRQISEGARRCMPELFLT